MRALDCLPPPLLSADRDSPKAKRCSMDAMQPVIAPSWAAASCADAWLLLVRREPEELVVASL